MTGPARIAPGGETIGFSFDGVHYRARPGDTLAAALLANGVGLVGRSFKYHRPRGILGAGVEEPNALVTVGEGGRAEPNTRATDVFVYEGLVARSQNRWPSLAYDLGAVFGLASRALPAGFYYKTFFGPAQRWLKYEWFIRRAAGLGPAPAERDPDRFSQRAAFCDVLVVGGGPSGLSAALEAARSGARVILVEQDRMLGASLIRDADPRATAWLPETEAALHAAGVRILTATTASGFWDHTFLTLTQRLAEPAALPPQGVAQRLWHVRAGRVVLATGLIERPLAFENNDRPGVMLARAVRSYIRRFGVLPGRRAVIATNNDEAYRTADALAEAGADVVAILDSRRSGPPTRFPVHHNARPEAAHGGRHCLTGVTALVGDQRVRFDADLLAISGGFTPLVHLHSQAGGKLRFDEATQAFLAAESPQACATVGSAAAPPPCTPAQPVGDPKRSFVDFQNDVSLADVDIAWAEGYRSVEHLKRYTTLGMATDQGKTSNMGALARLAEKQGVTIPDAGLTTFRPPFTPVTMGLLAGPAAADAGAPVRRIALHAAHAERKPIWQPLGYWFRPRAYPRGGETLEKAALREARAVRTKVGLADVSTLAKFEVTGPDAAALLELACATPVARLAVGRGRYTIMLREDGMVMDDGTVWRLAEDRYLLTSSTGGADRMAHHLSYVRQYLRPGFRVSVVNVQEHDAGLALAGPRASAVLAALTGTEPPRHMGVARALVAGTPVLLLGASYSGERAFEIYAEATHIRPVFDALAAAVEAESGALYGLEAMELLRIEKGHVVVGGEVDGRLTPADLGLAKMLNKSGSFIGANALARPALADPARLQLVGLKSVSGAMIPEGSMLLSHEGGPAEGHVTASARRILEGGGIALAHLSGGLRRAGDYLIASSPTRGQAVRVRVVAPHFYDPEGTRFRD